MVDQLITFSAMVSVCVGVVAVLTLCAAAVSMAYGTQKASDILVRASLLNAIIFGVLGVGALVVRAVTYIVGIGGLGPVFVASGAIVAIVVAIAVVQINKEQEQRNDNDHRSV